VTNGKDSYFLLCDQVGTPLALATTDGHVVQTMQYDSFGNLLQVRGDAVRLPLGFAGGLFDADTGLTRFVWRDYDADTGRFTALDPMGAKGGDKDWYGYCVDDPVNRMDAWGLSAIALPGPFGLPVPPVFIPGTPENDQFTKGTLDILKGLGGVWDGSDEPDNDPNTYESEHTTNQTPSNRNRHEEGQARKQRDKGGEKKEQRPDWRGNPNKRRKDQSDEGSPDSGGFADNGFDSDTEDEA